MELALFLLRLQNRANLRPGLLQRLLVGRLNFLHLQNPPGLANAYRRSDLADLRRECRVAEPLESIRRVDGDETLTPGL